MKGRCWPSLSGDIVVGGLSRVVQGLNWPLIEVSDTVTREVLVRASGQGKILFRTHIHIVL